MCPRPGGMSEAVGALEHAARILAAGCGTGHPTRCVVSQVGVVIARGRGESVGIAWRGAREESAARSIRNGTRAPALHGWARDGGNVAIPIYYPDRDALAALSSVERVPAELLQVYALEHWHRWPLVEHAALAAITGHGSREAICDAMGRILWRVAAVSQDERAKRLGMRAASFRAATREAEAMLRRWLDRGARQLLRAMKGSGPAQPRTGSDPCGLARSTLWNKDEAKRIAPIRLYGRIYHLADGINEDGPADAKPLRELPRDTGSDDNNRLTCR
jgi:hypothetical protein